MPELTERQKAAWPNAVAQIHEVAAADRGHLISAVLIIDGWWAQVGMDVYGYPNVSVSTWDPVHCTDDEDCPCVYCTAERAEDKA